jgi:signal transduction histidine kinase
LLPLSLKGFPTISQTSKSVAAEFPVRIDRRLTIFFSFLVFLVAIVGGTSLYLARSIFIATQEIKKESDRIDLVDRMHYTVHHLIEEVERTALQVTNITEEERAAYFGEIRNLLRRYDAEGGLENQITTRFWRAVRDLEVVSDAIVKQIAPAPGRPPRPKDLQALAGISGEIQGLAHGLSGTHRLKMEQLVRESSWKMQVILWLYGGFVVIGAFLVLASSLFFFRSVAQPLRSLAQSAGEIAEGKLDKKVTVRSKDEIGQLSHAFNVMADRLKEKERELQGMATLQERERIAQELHDTLAQELVLLQMKLNEAEMDLPRDPSSPISRAFNDIRAITERAYEEVRQSIFGLRTMVSKSLGLIPTLTEYLHDYSEMRKIPVALKIAQPEAVAFAPHVEVQLIRIVHEALANVFKHAEAQNGMVSVVVDRDSANVVIEDDGKGFVVSESAHGNLHFGLKTMRERAEAVGGRLTVDSAPGKGTRVIVVLPLDERVR